MRALLLLVTLSFMLSANAASFDCSNPKKNTHESMVCEDPALSQLDSEVAELYKKVFEASTNKKVLAERAVKWMETITVCPTKSCLLENYKARKIELENIRNN